MLRHGASRLRLAVQYGATEESLLIERLASGKLAGSSGEGGVARVWRGMFGTMANATHTVNALPLSPTLQRLHRERGLLSRLFQRLFSSSGNTPKGFEKFAPKGAKGSAAESTGGSGSGGSGGSGGAGGNKKDPDVREVNISLNNVAALAGGLAVAYLLLQATGSAGRSQGEISFQEFKAKLLAQGLVSRLEVANNSLVKVYLKPDVALGDPLGSGLGGAGGASPGAAAGGVYRYYFKIGSVDSFERKLDEAQHELGIASAEQVPVKFVHEVSLMGALLEVAPTMILMGVTYWLITRQMRQMTGGLPGAGLGGRGGSRGGAGGFFGMVKANVAQPDKTGKIEKMTFKDVAGCDEAKVEIMEFVDFLKNPQKYKDLGAKIPKGALLVGPPGTGKTLLAKATAGEAAVPFLSISGSDFMEMFVGVGPARVRDLFAQARAQSPSIIFIDEIDAIGRARGRGGAMGGHDERENTLNQLLVEMDGFATTSGVVVLGGTNRPDILDKALMRPGRFDRMITVDAPDIKGRIEIFKVHLAKLKLAKPLAFYAERLASLTPGMAGADIANICNEAALVAARHNKEAVEMVDFEHAIDRVIGGLEKKNKVISLEERRTVAFHEAGHAVVSWFLEHAEPLLKVSIVPRGTSVLGFAQYLPNENLLLTKEQLLDRVCATLGGRAAEQVLIGRISTGAVNDLERITQIAYSQVAVYGMNENIGLVSFRMDREAFDKPYSDATARMIDEEVRSFVDMAYKKTVKLVEEKKDLIAAMANELLKKEVIDVNDVERLLGKRPFTNAEMRNIDRFRHGSEAAAMAAPGGPSSSPEAEAAADGAESAGGDKPPGSGEEAPPSAGDDEDKGGKGKGSGGGGKANPGVVVAT